MMSATSGEAIALFGSTIRGDADQYSDKDLLFLSDDIIDREKNSFSALGYSVSSFTWTQFERMANEGSLFLQHLKQESKIVHDPAGRLASVLRGFWPCRDLGLRITDNLALFRLSSGTPNDPATIGWAFDVLAIALRNHAVLIEATNGRYVFSYPKLIENLAGSFGLSTTEHRLLDSLRILKREYRCWGKVSSVGWRHLLEVQSVVEKVVGISCVGTPRTADAFVAERLSVEPIDGQWYYALRSYEGAFRAVGRRLNRGFDTRARALERTIRIPSPYSLADFGSLASVREYIQELASTTHS